jgi:uncharacterized protein (TIGR03083 family)
VPTYLPKDVVVNGLHDVWQRLDALLSELDDADWDRPTCLPGWNVRAVVAHIIGTENVLLGNQPPPLDVTPESHPHVRNDIGRLNEAWVAALGGLSPADLLARFRADVERRKAALAETTQEAWDTVGFTPAGQDTYGRFMRIRVFDQWMHELDIRDAVGRPGGEGGPAAELALDEMEAALGFVVGKKAGAPQGARVRFALTGDAGRTVDVEVAERAAVVDALSGPPTLTVTMPVGVFARLCGGRADPAALRPDVTIEGDDELGQRLVANMAYTI